MKNWVKRKRLRNLVELFAYKPDIDIKVIYIGIRDIIETTRKKPCFLVA